MLREARAIGEALAALLMRSRCIVLVVAVGLVHGQESSEPASQIRLTGEESSIRFGSGAVLQAKCGSSPAASVKYLSPRSTFVRAVLQGVPRTCTRSTIAEPCASPDPFYPRLFRCVWRHSLEGSPIVVGPLKALSEKETDADGEVLGFNVFVECPVLSAEELEGLIAPASVPVNLTLSVTHVAASDGTPVALPFTGVAGGNKVELTVRDTVALVSGSTAANDAGTTPAYTYVKLRGTDGAIEDAIYASAALKVASVVAPGAVTAGHVDVAGGVTSMNVSTGDLTTTGSLNAASIDASGDVIIRGKLTVLGATDLDGKTDVDGGISQDSRIFRDFDTFALNQPGVATNVDGSVPANWGAFYLHLKTNVRRKAGFMYSFHIEGYSYGGAKIISRCVGGWEDALEAGGDALAPLGFGVLSTGCTPCFPLAHAQARP